MDVNKELMLAGHPIPVLDKGYLKLVAHMGSDEMIVDSARMSTGRGFVSWDPYKRPKGDCGCFFTYAELDLLRKEGKTQCEHGNDFEGGQDFPRGDLGLLENLWANRHTTPFECGGELMVEAQAPIMVFREWHRHRTQSYNEFSARYAQMPDLHYLPLPGRIQKQSKTNKQGSAEPVGEEEARFVLAELEREQSDVYQHYDRWVDEGIAKEVARLNTPVSRYSKHRAKTDLWNWLAFLRLRMHPTAQWEIRQYANAIAEIIKAIWPRTWALFEEHTLGSVNLSRTQAALLVRYFNVCTPQPGLLKNVAQEMGVEERVVKDLVAKLWR